MFRKSLFFIVCMAIPCLAFADTIYFKNGKTLKAERAWEEDGQIKCDRSGTVVGYPKNIVLRVETDGQNVLDLENEILGIKWGENIDNVKGLSYEGIADDGKHRYKDTSKKMIEGIPVVEAELLFCEKKLCGASLEFDNNGASGLVAMLKQRYGAPGKITENKNEKGIITHVMSIWILKKMIIKHVKPVSDFTFEVLGVSLLPSK